MFCKECGHQLDDDAKFCPKCGAKVISQKEVGPDKSTVSNNSGLPAQPQNVTQNNASSNATSSETKEKINWKEYLTLDNIERFAPIATLSPLAMALVIHVIGTILLYTITNYYIGYQIYKVFFFVFKTLFVIVPLAATAGLIYVVVKKKDVSKISSWVAPWGTLLATIACFGIAFGCRPVAWIFGIISVILGLEFMARIVILGQPIDSPINPGSAFNTYKEYFNNYKAKYPTTKDLEKAGIVDPENSKFDGSGIELLGYTILSFIVCTITCGIAAPWMICKIYKWKVSHTVINGKRLTFTGNGASLLGHWILWELLTIVTCGIYGFFLHVALRKWELNRTYIEGEPIIANGNESYFDGGSFAYFGYGLLSGLLLAITCGLAYPWVMAMLQKWDTKHQVINRRRLVFSGSGLGFLGEYLIICILSIITCGIYIPWGNVRLQKYIIRHTDFVN